MLVGLSLSSISNFTNIKVSASEFLINNSVTLNSTAQTSPMSVNTGTPFTYYINYSCQSTVGDCQGNKIVLDLTEFVVPINETLPSGITKTYDANLGKYILEFTQLTPSGTTGQIGINV